MLDCQRVSLPRLVRIVTDERVPPGEFHVGGVRVVNPRTDEDLGRELRTTEVRVHGDAERAQIGKVASARGFEVVE